MGSNQDHPPNVSNLGDTTLALPSWEQLGGTTTIRRVVGLLVDRAVVDPHINYDRSGTYPQNVDSIERTKSLALAFLSSALGGPLPYAGRSLALVHRPMAISAAELDAFLAHFEDAMCECGLTAPVVSQLKIAIAEVRPLILGIA